MSTDTTAPAAGIADPAVVQGQMYKCYGLTLHSEFRLPELEVTDPAAAPDVIIREAAIDRPLPESPTERGCYQATIDEALVYYKPLGQLLIRNGREIIVDPVDGESKYLRHHIVQGMAMGILLNQRGHLTLHASGVAIDGQAAAFVGWKRMGKSTTAAALYAAGHRLLTDDTVVLDGQRRTTVLPGFSQIRLEPEAVAAGLGLDPDDVPRLHPAYDKRSGRATDGFDLTPLPLGCLFFLEWGDEFHIEPMSAHDAFVELLRHSYAQRFLGKAGATRQHFQHVEHLAQHVPTFRLTRPRQLERLPELVSLIQSHMRG